MTKITKSTGKVVREIVAAADIYVPTPDQRRVKAEFHAMRAEGPSKPIENTTVAFAVQLTDCLTLEKWWPVPGFKRWFLDVNSFDTQAEALAGAALDVIGSIMFHAERDADKLSAAKLLVEIAGKVKKAKTEVQFLDKDLPDDPKKLDEFIARSMGDSV